VPRYIRLRRLPVAHARAAKKAGFHVEAIQTLHAAIELQLRELLLIEGANRRGRPVTDEFGYAWNVSNEMSYMSAAASAYVSGLLSLGLHGQLKRFNSVRNAMIHKMLYEPYEKEYPGVPYPDYVAVFKLGVSLEEQLASLVHGALMAPSNKLLERTHDR